jgi:hypothetical protein
MATKSRSKAKPAAPKRKQTLGGFFRSLHKNSTLMDQFSSGPEGRKQVIEASNLPPEHKALLKEGCTPKIIQVMAGIPTSALGIMVVNCCDMIGCGHEHCEAFNASSPAPGPIKAGAKKKAAPRKKR